MGACLCHLSKLRCGCLTPVAMPVGEIAGKRFVPTTRTWSNSTYSNGLDAGRSAEQKAEIVDELFDHYAALVAQELADHGMDYVPCYAVIEKL